MIGQTVVLAGSFFSSFTRNLQKLAHLLVFKKILLYNYRLKRSDLDRNHLRDCRQIGLFLFKDRQFGSMTSRRFLIREEIMQQRRFYVFKL
ncbi:hypothetical protein D932_02554 [Enterococcus casseliflavus 14-MB-W-14]|uniref:Uncharacterized protein n=1 Tax=Enterococcus casseliflavus TaxID=37734 RepID=A0A415EU26_ENTCA|nr:hypothetical protein D932_02554 [Enterococcus casseliflavus 14-MB-W-14]MBE6170408.1 hypothetical protein [Enterococcus casseliflavus]MBO6347878.1 hypothetical protein [Enterococcus casseliflavus]MBO6358856.1 hypothetical protein [Enterococcus casseliflavus]MBO6365938.1 hypothetical protein [Enterococcus casseliflavus]